MTSGAGIRVHVVALAVAGAAFAAACAPKTAPLPPPGGAARYPDYVVPAVPDGLGTPASRDRHEAGWLWLQAGDLRAAERNFTAALKLEPGFYPAEAGLGYVGLAREEPKQALQHFDRAIVANPRYAAALVGRGEALLATGEREMALETLEAAVAADPELASLRGRIEVLRFRALQDDVAAARKAAEAGRFEQARRAYEQAIRSSPESPFLHRELAGVEQRAGNFEAALQHAARAAELDPTDARSYVLTGEIHEARYDLAKAVEAYDTAVALDPNPDLEARIESLRERLLLAAMPAEFQEIERAAEISRAELAALLGVRLDDLLKRAPKRSAVVFTDSRGHWAAPWIISVTRAGVMEVYANHTFQPFAIVRRGDLAEAASNILTLIAAERPRLGESWRRARRRFPDVSPAHLSYPAASLAVEAGVLTTAGDGSFDLTRPVSGAEAVAAVRKLEDLAKSGTR